MPTSPCCCCSLQTGTRVIGVLEIIGSILWAVLLIVGWINLQRVSNEQKVELPGIFIAIVVITLIMCVVSLGLGILLVIAANQRDAGKCKIWFNVTLVLTIIFVILTIISIFGGHFDAGSIVSFLVQIYLLWVVHAFIDEIKSGGGEQGTPYSA